MGGDPAGDRKQVLTRIFIDADACPVKEEVYRVAARHGVKCFVVSNSWIRVPPSPLIEPVIVDEGFDAADNWIVDNVAAGDVVITSDIPLADRALQKSATAIAPNGRPFTERSIGMALAMRSLNDTLRQSGELSGRGSAFSRHDRSRFLNTLENVLQKLRRR